jgi:hypothetical protein
MIGNMKTSKLSYSFLVLLIFCFNAVLLFDLKSLKVEMQKNFDEQAIQKDDFKRGDLIRQVAKGDANAAFALGRYYGSKGIHEAQLHWFEIARELGHEGISEEALRGIERSVINAHLE